MVMKFETLKKDRITSMKNKDLFRKQVLSNMIDAIQKASITSKGRIEITEDLVNDTLIKYQKITQEMIDTCPNDRQDKMEEYNKTMVIVKEYAPQKLTDEKEIKTRISNILYSNSEVPDLSASNKGKIMKILSPLVKNEMDMKIVNKVVDEILTK